MLDIIRRNSQSWGVKIIFALIIIVFVFWGASAVNTPPVNVIATVNGESIYGNDFAVAFEQELQSIRQRNPSFELTDDARSALSQQTVGQLVYMELIKQNAEKYGLAASDHEFTHNILAAGEFRDADGKFSKEIFDRYFKVIGPQMGVTEDSYSESLMVGKLLDYIALAARISDEEARYIYNYQGERRVVEYVVFPAADYMAQVKPEEKEVGDYYEANKSRFTVSAKADLEYITVTSSALGAKIEPTDEELAKYHEARSAAFVEPMRYHSSHILIRAPFGVEESDPALKAARDKLAKAQAELAAGKDFESVAKKYSDDADTSGNGGELGWMSMGQYEPAYEDAVQGMKEGEVSGPVRSLNGFHVIRLESVEPERIKPLAEVRDQVLALYREDNGAKALQKELNTAQDKITIGAPFEKIAEEYGLTPASTGLADVGLLPERLDVPAESMVGLSGMKSGALLPNPLEKPGSFLVVRVKELQPEFVRPLPEVHDQIVATLKEQGAYRLAVDAAKAAAEEVAAADGKLPGRLAEKVRHTANTSRQYGIPELGGSADLTAAVFTAPTGAWMKTAYPVKEGAALLMVKESLMPTSPEWIKDSNAFTAMVNQLYQSELLQIYQESLRQQADIKVLNANPYARQ